jgi:hypothetical protein
VAGEVGAVGNFVMANAMSRRQNDLSSDEEDEAAALHQPAAGADDPAAKEGQVLITCAMGFFADKLLRKALKLLEMVPQHFSRGGFPSSGSALPSQAVVEVGSCSPACVLLNDTNVRRNDSA